MNNVNNQIKHCIKRLICYDVSQKGGNSSRQIKENKQMTIKFKIAALNALSKSYNSSDILAISSVRTSVKGKDLKVGDIVKNSLKGGFYQVASIDKGSLCYLVTLDCCASVDGQTFTMDLVGDYIDVYVI